MKRIFTGCLALITLLTACNQKQTESTNKETLTPPVEKLTYGFYIGTYTDGDSKGIYNARFNATDGSFTDLKLAAPARGPSFVTISPDRKHAFAVNEYDQPSGFGLLRSFAIAEDGSLEPVDSVSSHGRSPCYLSFDPQSRVLMAANYGSGNVVSHAVAKDGKFIPESDVEYRHEGDPGPQEDRQEGPHAHTIVVDPAGEYALSSDLGLDKVIIFKLNESGIDLSVSPRYVSLKPGSGPRHLAFHPNGKFVYVINELNSTITAFSYADGRMEEFQTIGTLPDGFTDFNKCADIHVHPNGKFLFGSNRGENSIVSYLISDDGMLSLAGYFHEGVNWPRNFAVSPDGNYVLVANRNSDDVVSARINMGDGTLSAVDKLAVPSPVCIVFE